MQEARATSRASLRSIAFAVALALAAATTLVACGGDEPEPVPTGGAGLANPASVFCESRGGTVEIVDEPAGQRGICVFPDGTRIDEWEYFRSMNPDADVSPSP